MRKSSSILVLTALAASASGHRPAQYQSPKTNWTAPEIPHPYWWEGPASVSLKQQLSGTQTAVPLPTLSYHDTPIKSQQNTPTIAVTPCETPSNSAALQVPTNWSPGSSFYVIPPHFPSTTSQPSAVYAAPSSSAASYISWTPYVGSQPPNSVVLSTPSASTTTVPVPQQAYSNAVNSTPASASTPIVVIPNAVSSEVYTPGVILSSTPGVIPSYTPGVVPSFIPGILPSLVSSQPLSPPSAQPSAPTTIASAPQSSVMQSIASDSVTPVPTTLTITASIPAADSSIISSPASTASPASSLAPPSSNPVSPTQASSSTQQSWSVSSAVVANTSARSTLSTTTTAPSSSASAQSTSIPPAPIAGGSSGSFSSRGKERVWWLTFLVPLVVLV